MIISWYFCIYHLPGWVTLGSSPELTTKGGPTTLCRPTWGHCIFSSGRLYSGIVAGCPDHVFMGRIDVEPISWTNATKHVLKPCEQFQKPGDLGNHGFSLQNGWGMVLLQVLGTSGKSRHIKNPANQPRAFENSCQSSYAYGWCVHPFFSWYKTTALPPQIVYKSCCLMFESADVGIITTPGPIQMSALASEG